MSEELDALETEAEQDDNAPVKVLLKTEEGQGTFYVPPFQKWRTRERHALLKEADDYTWAHEVLSEKDCKRWLELNPDLEEVGAFIDAFFRVSGLEEGKVKRSTTSSKSTRKR